MPRKRSNVKKRIVKASWKLFHQKGYESTTVADIIKAAKTTKGTFYAYFKGKDALLETLADLFDDKYEELNETMPADMDSLKKLAYLNHELFSMIEEEIDVRILASLYSTQLLSKEKRFLRDHDRIYFRIITDIILDGIKKGEITAPDPAEDLMRIYSIYEHGILYDWALCDGNYSLTALSDKNIPYLLERFKR